MEDDSKKIKAWCSEDRLLHPHLHLLIINWRRDNYQQGYYLSFAMLNLMRIVLNDVGHYFHLH